MLKKELIKKAKMPEPKAKDAMLELSPMDLEEGSSAEESLESPDQESAEGDIPQMAKDKLNETSSELEHVADEDLIAEMKKRGLNLDEAEADMSLGEEMPVMNDEEAAASDLMA